MHLLTYIFRIIIAIFSISSVSVANDGILFDEYKNIEYLKNVKDSSLQSLDIYSPKKGSNLPVVVFIHGGGWSTGDKAKRSHLAKRDFFIKNNMVFVSANYRLAPKYSFPDYPQDVASAVAFVVDNISKYKGDPDNIFLFGHSAGAHLIALVSTNSEYLELHNKSLKNIKGTILLDGAGYDINMTLRNNRKKRRQRMFEQAFGTDKEVWSQASPITHVNSSENLPPFLMFYVKKRKASQEQSLRFSSAIKNANGSVKVIPINNTSHKKINTSFGLQMDKKEKSTLKFIQKKRY